MTPLRLFIISVQKELADERRAIRDFLNGDALMHKFFEVFLFEDVPAADFVLTVQVTGQVSPEVTPYVTPYVTPEVRTKNSAKGHHILHHQKN